MLSREELLAAAVLIFYAAVGAFVLYCKLRSEEHRTIEFIPHLAPRWKSRWRPACEAVTFSLIGGFVSYALVQPATLPQALAAGLGWTGLVSAVTASRDRKATP
jgi:hypothetical protein